MKTRYAVGIDIGTSATKTTIYSEQGEKIASASAEYQLYQPQNGWAEQDPQDWWKATVDTLRASLSSARIHAEDIVGIGLSGQMHGLVMLDEHDRVLRKSIIWCDGRTEKECEEITQLVGQERLLEITANPALPGFTASKIRWVQKNEPDLYKQCRHILLPKDYIRFMLTGEYATEVSDASGMQLLDVPNRCWSEEICTALNIDTKLLPTMHESVEITGRVHSYAASATGLAAGTPVVGGAGDNAASAIGIGVVREGQAFTTIGTSGVTFAHTDSVHIDPKGRVHTFCSAVPGCWTVMSCTLAAGLSLKWFRDTFCESEKAQAAADGQEVYDLLTAKAKEVPIGANRLIYLPYLMGERSPILDVNSRGVFFGLSAIHTKYDMLRAVMEGVIYSQRHCLDVLREMQVAPKQLRACGGGAASPLWRQMLADVCSCAVVTAVSTEGGSFGAAILAFVGTGVFDDVRTACDKLIAIRAPQQPNLEDAKRYEAYYEVYRSLYPALREEFSRLAAIKA